MTITHIGGDMPAPFTWRISLNGAPIAQNTFQLTAGQSFNINTSGLFGTLTLDVLDPTNTVIATGSMFCQSPTATATPSPMYSATPAPSATDTPTAAPTATNTDTPTAAPSATDTPTPTFTPSPTATQTPVPPRVISSNPRDYSRLEKGPAKSTIVFSQEVIQDGSSHAANNLANYLLVESGPNHRFDTTSCFTGRSGDDVALNFSSVLYKRAPEQEHDRLSFTATLRLNPALSSGRYRLFVCGGASIENLAGTKLNHGVDTAISFTVTGDDRKGGRLAPRPVFETGAGQFRPRKNNGAGLPAAGFGCIFPRRAFTRELRKQEQAAKSPAFACGWRNRVPLLPAIDARGGMKMSSSPAGQSRAIQSIVTTSLPTPFGPMLAGAVDEGICLLEFTDGQRLEIQLRRLSRRLNAEYKPGWCAHFDRLQAQLDGYFSGGRREFDLPLVLPGTPFQQKVWAGLQTIPYGSTRSYTEQAKAIGLPQAVRAVAKAQADNRIAIILPCHRVIGAQGELTGYGGGLWRKQYLLQHEASHGQL